MGMSLEFVSQLPWPVTLLLAIVITGVLSKALAWACDPFEEAAVHLGRNFPVGIKGATINAIGSSMPELFTMVALLFLIPGAGIMLAGPGIAVTAGSAVFNSDIIPAAVILMTLVTSVKLTVFYRKYLVIEKSAMLRDFSFMLLAEILLIVMLGGNAIGPVSCLLLIGIYAAYCLFMWVQTNAHDSDEDASMTTRSAWWQLTWSTAAIIVLCVILAEFIVVSAEALGVHPIITALFLGAAASSVPDTIMSVRMARKGDYEDAIANALGSNTFDICIAMAGPLLVYTLIHGPVEIAGSDVLQQLRIGLLIVTIAIAMLILIPKRIRAWQGVALLVLYVIWSMFVLNTEFHWV